MNDTGGESAAALPRALEKAVEDWWQDQFPGSPLAQITQIWNHAFLAKEDLKQRIAKLIAGGR